MPSVEYSAIELKRIDEQVTVWRDEYRFSPLSLIRLTEQQLGNKSAQDRIQNREFSSDSISVRFCKESNIRT